MDWKDIDLETLKANRPELLEEFQKSLPAKETEGPGDDDDDDDAGEGVKLSKKDIAKIVKEQVDSIIGEATTTARKQAETTKKVVAQLAKSGLPERTRNRLAAAFSAETEYNEKTVQEAIEDAKEELKEAGAGTRITGMGPSRSKNAQEDGEEDENSYTVKESVEEFFTGPKKKDPKKGAEAGSKS